MYAKDRLTLKVVRLTHCYLENLVVDTEGVGKVSSTQAVEQGECVGLLLQESCRDRRQARIRYCPQQWSLHPPKHNNATVLTPATKPM